MTLGQGVWLERRLRKRIAAGNRHYEVKSWLGTSLPIFVVESFYLLLTYVDILALEHFGSPHDVAVYYAGARLLAIVAFVYFAIAGATTHKFTRVSRGRRQRAAAAVLQPKRSDGRSGRRSSSARVILALGNPLLSLFGPGSTTAMP